MSPATARNPPQQPRSATGRDATDRQLQALAAIHGLRIIHGCAPTVRELGDRLGLRSTNSTNDLIRALLRKGLVTQYASKARTMRLTPAGLRALGIGAPARRDSSLPDSVSASLPVVDATRGVR